MGYCEKRHFLRSTNVYTFWATFGENWVTFFLQHLVTVVATYLEALVDNKNLNFKIEKNSMKRKTVSLFWIIKSSVSDARPQATTGGGRTYMVNRITKAEHFTFEIGGLCC